MLLVALGLALVAAVIGVAGAAVPVHWGLSAAVFAGLYGIIVFLAVRTSRRNRAALELELELSQRRAQLELQQGLMASEQRYRVVFEHAPEGVFLCDADGVIVSANAAAHRIFGHRDGALIGARFDALVSDEPAAGDLMAVGGDNGIPVLRAGARADGGDLVVGVTARNLSYGGHDLKIALVRDVTDFIRQLRHIEGLHEAALAREQGRAELIATMSHEVRTPLNGVVGMVQLLSDDDLAPDQRELVGHIQRSARALVEVLDDLLSASSLGASGLSFEQSPFDALELVEEVVVLHREAAERKGLELVVGATAGLCRDLVGDPLRVRQVVSNLVGNAIKFTHAGHVRVDVDTREAGPSAADLLVSVKDTGVGIPPDMLEQIFERYTRVAEPGAPAIEGTGLGLSIAREIARRMGGDVTARSARGEGAELTFAARLARRVGEAPPVRALAGQRVMVALRSRVAREQVCALLSGDGALCVGASGARHLRDGLSAARDRGQPFAAALVDRELLGAEVDSALTGVPVVLSSAVTDRLAAQEAARIGAAAVLRRPLLPSRLLAVVRDAAQAEAGAPQPTAPALAPRVPVVSAATGPFAGRRVLVAEDNPTNQRVAMVMIGKLGCDVDLAVDGRAAIEKVREGDYDLVFMDGQMPEIDGYDAAREIRGWGGAFEALPIIALTASAGEDERQRSLAAGMSDHLTKPVTREAFRRTLERWLPPAEDAAGG